VTSYDQIFLGIDPGLNGGLAWLQNGKLIDTCIMPVKEKNIDLRGLYIKIQKYAVSHAFIEKVHAMPKQGVSSMFKFGYGLGAIEATVACLCIPYTMIPPQSWTRFIHKGLDPMCETSKEKSALAASMLFPNHNFIKSKRSFKPHDGMIDAALIAEFGSQNVFQNNTPER